MLSKEGAVAEQGRSTMGASRGGGHRGGRVGAERRAEAVVAERRAVREGQRRRRGQPAVGRCGGGTAKVAVGGFLLVRGEVLSYER